jgi:hypothetical protein
LKKLPLTDHGKSNAETLIQALKTEALDCGDATCEVIAEEGKLILKYDFAL